MRIRGVRGGLTIGILAGMALIAGCAEDAAAPSPLAEGDASAIKDASSATVEMQAAARSSLPFDDTRDFELARLGHVVSEDALTIPTDEGGPVPAWDMTRYAFIDGEAPDTVHPGLWRQAQLNQLHGLYEITDGIWQVRGYDLSNITFVRGDTGWIVIDPLISVEPARAALDLVNGALGERPVTAVIYTHSHVDHFGGVKGVTSEEDVAAGRVRIVAPEGFMHHAISENVLAGNVMGRRASYMFGRLLPPGPRGQVDTGLGRTTSTGQISLIPPTDVISNTPKTLTLDGVEIVFQNTPGAEAPAEMMFYFPQFKALCVAEEANATLHNMYTLRGAQVRSGKLWAEWLDEAIVLFGDDLELVFGSHHWPRIGREPAIDFLEKQRDTYKYIHDQTLRLANQGYSPIEIAEAIELPEALSQEWFNRGFYGTVSHNVKATYQLYLGWFDANPANLNPLPPADSAVKYVEYMGGAEAVLERARGAYAAGDYRWVAEVVNKVVFAEPDNAAARALQADALEQLGYQSESGPWRNFYLTGAQELRQGVADLPAPNPNAPDIVLALTPEMLFDLLSVRLNGPDAADQDITLNLRFTDSGRDFAVHVARGVLNYRADTRAEEADVGLTLSRPDFIRLLNQDVGIRELMSQDRVELEGNPLTLATFAGLFDRFEFWFPIVTP